MIDFETLQYCQRRNPKGVARLKAFLGLQPDAPVAAIAAACAPRPVPQPTFRVQDRRASSVQN